MNIAHDIAAGVSLVSGLAAAGYWWMSSRIAALPGPSNDSGDALVRTDSWISGILEASQRSAQLNARASTLTAISVAAGTLLNYF